jgi:hypothetical protein
MMTSIRTIITPRQARIGGRTKRDPWPSAATPAAIKSCDNLAYI